jgi:hypothetical protein
MTDRKEIIKLVEKVNSMPMRQAFYVTDKDGYIESVEYQNLFRPSVNINMSPLAFAEMAREL